MSPSLCESDPSGESLRASCCLRQKSDYAQIPLCGSKREIASLRQPQHIDRNYLVECGVYALVSSLRSAAVLSLFLCVVPMSRIVTASQVRYPWVYPGDFNERLARADLVVSGTIASTVPDKLRIVDGVKVSGNEAEIRVDRVFKGEAKSATMHFLWYSPAPACGGVVYSGPPFADFKPKVRYLVFLRQNSNGYVVTIPIYEMEVRLARPGSAVFRDLSQVPISERKSEIAKEIEAAALSVPHPAPGVTGDAARYFPYVVDLIGGCAEPFLRHFAVSRSKELRAAAQNWLAFVVNKGLRCSSAG